MKISKKITALFLAFSLFFSFSLPGASSAITIQEEKELAQEFLAAIHRRYKIIKDPAVHDYINTVGRRIVKELPPQPFTYKFYVIEQDTYNAFAGPGCNIFVFSGLFEALSHEGELAALLAHEIAHASCRHISEMIESSKKRSILSLAGMVAGILVGIGGASEAGSALAMGTMAAGESLALAYTREKEMQADQIGRLYLQKAGYDLHSMLSLLKTIHSQEWFGKDQIPTYLRTHPATEDRLIYLSTTLSGKPPPAPEDSHPFDRARIRLSALHSKPQRAAENFSQALETRPGDPMLHYGYGLALARTGEPEKAVSHLNKAAEAFPNDPFIEEDLGRAYFLNSSYKKAQEILRNSAENPETGPEGKFYLGRSQLALGQTRAAAETFKGLVEEYPDYLPALYFLGKSYSMQNDPGNAHYHLGLYHMGKHDDQNAAFHFRQALKKISDREKIKKINELMKEIGEGRRGSPEEGEIQGMSH